MIIDELGNVRAWDGGDNRKIDTSMASFGPVEVRDHWRVRFSTLVVKRDSNTGNFLHRLCVTVELTALYLSCNSALTLRSPRHPGRR